MDGSLLTPFSLNGRLVDLRRGAVTDSAGHAVTLRAQTAEVLKVLAAKPGKIIGKDELMRTVWGDIVVTDDSLVQCITEIRKALGDDTHEIVRTLPKRGYVLEATAQSGLNAAATPAGPRAELAVAGWESFGARWIGIAVILAAIIALGATSFWPTGRAAVERPAIAVLPFQNLSADPKWDRFADGMSADIITDLTRFRDIPVIAQPSTESYRGPGQDVRAIGKTLDVEYVLQGGLQIELHRLRVTAQLVNTRTGQHIWSERYDRVVGDFFDVQDEITEKIAATLGSWQSPINQQKRAVAQRKSADQLAAYDYWLLGIAEKHKMTPASQLAARALLEKGLTLDPDFQPLVRDLSYTYTIELWLGSAKDPELALRKFHELAARAVELDPSDPLAWEVQATAASYSGDFEAERKHIEHALSLGPNNADLLILASLHAGAIGSPQWGVELADRAFRLNPHHPHWWNSLFANAYFFGGAFEKAYPHGKAAGLDSPLLASFQAMIAAQLGKEAEARAATTVTLGMAPDWAAERSFQVPPDAQKVVVDSAQKAGLPVCVPPAKIAELAAALRFEFCEAERAKTKAVN